MTDVSVFSEDKFVSTSWINGVLNALLGEESLDSLISTHSMKLHIMSQDYTDQLETAMVESMSIMPKILNEIKKIEMNLKLTENEMNNVSTQLNVFDERNFSGVEDLSRLDFVKANMEKCKSTLEEHARWSQLVREAQNMLNENGSCTLIAEEIETMFRSVEILKNLPGHEERQRTCEDMKSGLLLSLEPEVKKEISSGEFISLQDYLYVYKKLGREEELEEQYIAVRPTKIVATWSHVSGDLSTDITIYLSRVLQFIVLEDLTINSLFGAKRGAVLLCDILQNVFNPLHAALTQKGSANLSVSDAFDCFCVVDDFVAKSMHFLARVEQHIAIDTINAFFRSLIAYLPIYVESENKNVRMQLSQLVDTVAFGNCGLLDGGSGNVDDTLFGAERDVGDEYAAYSESLILVANGVHVPFEAALHRAIHFMGGVRSKLVIQGLFSALADSAKLIASRIDDLAVASCAASLNVSENQQSDVLSNSVAAINLAQQMDSSDVDIRLLITCSLRALQAVGRFQLRIEYVEHLTTQMLLDLNNSIFQTGQTIVGFDQLHCSLISTAAFSFLQDAHEASELRSFLNMFGSTQQQSAQDMFKSTMGPSMKRLQSTACELLFSLSIALPDKLFSAIVADDCWLASSDLCHTAESILPQSMITQVGEHLLSLVQELEAFASSDALDDLLMVRGQMAGLTIKSSGWQQIGQILQISEDAVLGRLCQKHSSTNALTILSKALFVNQDQVRSNDDDAPSFSFSVDETESNAVLSFVNEWLTVISDASIGMLLSKVVQTTFLSGGDVAQLLTDLNYMSNVAIAMGIQPHPLLVHLKMLLEKRTFCAQMLGVVELTLTTTGGDVQCFARFDRHILQAMVRGEGQANNRLLQKC